MRVPLLSMKRAVRSISAGEFFETNENMVLINDDQCDIADIVLDGWLFEKKLNHSSGQLDIGNFFKTFSKITWK